MNAMTSSGQTTVARRWCGRDVAGGCELGAPATSRESSSSSKAPSMKGRLGSLGTSGCVRAFDGGRDVAADEARDGRGGAADRRKAGAASDTARGEMGEGTLSGDGEALKLRGASGFFAGATEGRGDKGATGGRVGSGSEGRLATTPEGRGTDDEGELGRGGPFFSACIDRTVCNPRTESIRSKTT